MSKYNFVKPESLQQALGFMDKTADCFLIAGGTDLMVKLKEKRISPALLIDIGQLQELRLIDRQDGFVHIGAAVSHAELAESALIQQYAPMLSAAAAAVGSPQIRNRGTIGGNIGNASPAADTVPALLAYGARVTVRSQGGQRECSLESLLSGPGRTALASGEMITAVRLPCQQVNQKSSFQKLGKRRALSISVVNAGVFVEIDEASRIIQSARIVVGSVAPTAIPIREAETALLGQVLSPAGITRAGAIVEKVIKPIDDIRSTAAYRQVVAGILVKRALQTVWTQFKLQEVQA